jgi:hypothetical protein
MRAAAVIVFVACVGTRAHSPGSRSSVHDINGMDRLSEKLRSIQLTAFRD